MKRILFLLLFLLPFFLAPLAFAKSPAFISIVNPVRGGDFWGIKNQKIATVVLGQIEDLKKNNLNATWLLRFDALNNQEIINELVKRPTDEKGLFLEVTPTWATQAKIEYHKSDSWHSAGSAFLTGYERSEREKLIDVSFEKFKSIFGSYPLSVGAWWIDSYSLGYMQKKYGITSALIVADQYTTDNYQIWGQYFSTPYYPSKKNALHPAQTLENKLPVVITQWASRDPVNSYGNGVFESTFSIQANDYQDFHNLDTNYFIRLLDIYENGTFNQFSHLVVGLENSYEWNKYSSEYLKQLQVLDEKRNSGQLTVITLKNFAEWYKSSFPNLSPAQIIIADDPLGTYKKTVWFMDPYYRAGWFYNKDGSVFRDIRQYVDGEEELCFETRCDSINFATSATRVLDDVSFGHKWLIDEGGIKNFQINKQDDKFVITYQNEAGTLRKIEFLPRDIGIDGRIFSIDQAILDATKKENIIHQSIAISAGYLKWSVFSVVLKLAEFVIFLIFAVLFPGLVLTKVFFDRDSPLLLRLFISITVGLVVLTLIFYLVSLVRVKPLIFIYLLLTFILFIRLKLYNIFVNLPKPKGFLDLIILAVILSGVIFQIVPTFRSGLNFAYGMGFWGPNTHDGVWHMALVNQLIKSVPPENPVFSGIALKNYHFFYDLLVAITNYLTGLPVNDLIFRFFPIIFSAMLGIGSYYLAISLFKDRVGIKRSKVTAIFGLYLVFFAGSFGWIVEYLKNGHIGGESDFWVNQAVSFNLNPPFAISLVIMIAILHILIIRQNVRFKGDFILIILVGTLISFKSYTGVLILGSLGLMTLVKIVRKKDFSFFWIFFWSSVVSIWLFLSNFAVTSSLMIFSPFWFIHSMVDSPDRLGWVRLSLARYSSKSLGEWPKYVLVEVVSFLIFIFGNLGLRFLSFGSLVKIKETFKDDILLFIFITTLLASVIPILFIQSGNPWNTIQFFYPVLYVTAIFSGLVISELIFKLNKVQTVIFVGIFLFIAPVNSLATASGYLIVTPHALVSSKEMEGLQFLSKQQDGVVLAYPYDENLKKSLSEPWPLLAYDSTAYVSAFSKKSVYFEDEAQSQILLTDYKKRLVASTDFFLSSNTEKRRFLTDNNIRYIYLPKIYKERLDESVGYIKNIFENEEVVIYQISVK